MTAYPRHGALEHGKLTECYATRHRPGTQMTSKAGAEWYANCGEAMTLTDRLSLSWRVQPHTSILILLTNASHVRTSHTSVKPNGVQLLRRRKRSAYMQMPFCLTPICHDEPAGGVAVPSFDRQSVSACYPIAVPHILPPCLQPSPMRWRGCW